MTSSTSTASVLFSSSWNCLSEFFAFCHASNQSARLRYNSLLASATENVKRPLRRQGEILTM